MDIIAEIKQKQIDYSLIKDSCLFKNGAAGDIVDVSVIIPVHGRGEFNKIITRHFNKAIFQTDRRIALTFVEHAAWFEHAGLCESWVGHIGIPLNNKPFNKSLCHNIGALYGPQSKYLLFHDVDIIIPPDFFIKLFDNLRDNSALQTFSKRRLFEANEFLTTKLNTTGEDFFGVIPFVTKHIKELESGASGGSMFINRELFMDIGGFDAELFTEYSIEDQMFWDKILQKGKLGLCDDPAIDLVHLHHKPSFNRITKQYDWDVHEAYRKLDGEQLQEFYNIKKENFELHTSGKYKKFRELVNEWKAEMCMISDPQTIHSYKAVAEIIQLAPLEWVINDLRIDSWGGWFWVLEILTKCSVVPASHAGNIPKMTNDWITWYEAIYKS